MLHYNLHKNNYKLYDLYDKYNTFLKTGTLYELSYYIIKINPTRFIYSKDEHRIHSSLYHATRVKSKPYGYYIKENKK